METEFSPVTRVFHIMYYSLLSLQPPGSFFSSVEWRLDTFIFKFVAYDIFQTFMEFFTRSTVFISLTLHGYDPMNMGLCGIFILFINIRVL